MVCIRTHHDRENPYTQINNLSLRDPNLDLAATGLLAYMFSFKDDWVFNIPDICKRKKVGKRVVYRTLNELIQYGYVIRYQETKFTQGEGGKRKRHLGCMEYVIFETPKPYEDRKSCVLQFANSPYFPDDLKNPDENPESQQKSELSRFEKAQNVPPSELSRNEHAQKAPLRINIKKRKNIEEKEEETPPTPSRGENSAGASSPATFSRISSDIQQKTLPTPPLDNPEVAPTKSKEGKTSYRHHVFLTATEHDTLKTQYGEDKLNAMLDILDAYKGSSGKKYKSDYHTLVPHGWVHQRFLKEKEFSHNSVIAEHRKGSKLAFETKSDNWTPPPYKPIEYSEEEKEEIFREFGVRL